MVKATMSEERTVVSQTTRALGVGGKAGEGGIGVVERKPFELHAVAAFEKTDQRADDFPLPVFGVFEVEARLVAVGETLERDEQRVHRHVAVHEPVVG